MAAVLSPHPQAAGRAPLEDDQSRPSSPQAGQRQGEQNRGPRPPWWKDPAIVKEIALKAEQAQQIDQLWHDRAKEMSGRWDDFRKQDAELRKMMAERKVGPDVIALQVDRVEAQRTLIEKSRTVMLYRMSLVMTPEQNKALEAIRERSRRSGGNDR